MDNKTITIPKKKRIALVAHDGRKPILKEWVKWNKEILSGHELFATGTTGKMINDLGLETTALMSGPLGGDQQIGSMIAEGKLDVLFFFFDPLTAQPHDSDVKALIRLAVLWNIPIACDRSSADFMISSPLFINKYNRKIIDYGFYSNRKL